MQGKGRIGLGRFGTFPLRNRIILMTAFLIVVGFNMFEPVSTAEKDGILLIVVIFLNSGGL